MHRSRYILLFLLILPALLPESQLSAQNRNSIWIFGDSAMIDFSNTVNPVTGVSSMDGRGSCVTMADSSGNLLFYAHTRATIAGFTGRVYDATHQIMQNGDLIAGQGWYKEMVIIPDPAGGNMYYLFCIGVTNSHPPGLYYSTIDMNLNGGLGAVVQKNVRLSNSTTVDGIAAVKHGNGRDWWVLYRKIDVNFSGNKRYFKYLVDPSGVAVVDSQAIGQKNHLNAGAIFFNNQGTQMAFVNTRGLFDIMNFNRCTGHLSQVKSIELELPPGSIPWYFGGAFSPNDNYIYLSSNDNTAGVYKYDLSLQDPAASRDTVWQFTDSPQPGGMIKLAPDGKMYMSNAWFNGIQFNYPYQDTMFNYVNMNLSVVNDPDQPGLACNFQPYSFFLGGKRTYYGLPNNPDYDLPALAGSPCDTLTDIRDNVDDLNFILAPNPCTDHFNIHIPYVPEEKLNVVVSDMHGKQVVYEQWYPSGNTILKKISMKYLTSGMYIIQITGSTFYIRDRIVKQ